MVDIFEHKRKSYMEPGQLYFWTGTINKWMKLLEKDSYKQIITDSLAYLSDLNKIDVFGFVVMPNHIHLIWRIHERNGKETSHGSFLKHTAHKFRSMLMMENPADLLSYLVNASNKSHEFWKRDSLAIHLYTREVAYQKLDYIHNNPLAVHWQLATDPRDYLYSSASYYETGDNQFSFLKDLRGEL